MKEYNLLEIKSVIKDYINVGCCGLFFTSNLVGDRMTTVYDKNGVTVFLCQGYMYFEVFGLTEEDEIELLKFYNKINKDV